jgi:protocatechuate 3,4-dioxygenase alpha subunit
VKPALTPSQTVGPYFLIGLGMLFEDDLAREGVAGERITISGRIFDADGQPIPDAFIEIWQADANGTYPSADSRAPFRGWGRVATDENGRFEFKTIKPGAVGAGSDAPHINVALFMRGLLRHLYTRIYFAGENANDRDSVLNVVPSARRDTLVARKGDTGNYAWDIFMQGPHETVFLDW